MPRQTLTTRVSRIEELHADLAAKVNILFDAQIRTEERIEKLVSAIGELIRRMYPPK